MSDSLWPHKLCSPWNSPGQNTGVGSLSLLQGIFPTQGLNPGLLYCRQILHQLNHKGSPSTHSTKPQNRMLCPQWTKMPALLPWRKSHGENLATSGRPSRGDLYGPRAVKVPFGKQMDCPAEGCCVDIEDKLRTKVLIKDLQTNFKLCTWWTVCTSGLGDRRAFKYLSVA